LRKIRKKKIGIVLFVIVGVIAIAYNFILPEDRVLSLKDPSIVTKLEERELIKSISFAGKVESMTKNIVKTDIKNARVTKVYIKEGDYVKKGDTIADLDVQLIEEQIHEINENDPISENTRKNMKRNAEDNLQAIKDNKNTQLAMLAKQKQNVEEK